MELQTERFVAILLLVTGLSHLVQPARWSQLFTDLFRQPYAPLFIGVFTLPLGLYVVMTHNVWVAGLPVVVTVLGWAWTGKSVLYLLRPSVVGVIAQEKIRTARHFALAGGIMAALGAAVLWQTFPAAS